MRWVALFWLYGCTQAESVLATSVEDVRAQLNQAGGLTDAALGNKAVTYLGYTADPVLPQAGERVAITHYWVAWQKLAYDYDVFVHVLVQGARGYVAHGDHTPQLPTRSWPMGKVVTTHHTLDLPRDLPAAAIALRVGLFRGNQRLAVDAKHDDGTRRIRTTPLNIAGGAPLELPRYDVPHTNVAPTLDGVANETAWQAVPFTSDFVRSSGRGNARHRARAKLMHDATYLYAYLETDDPDIQATLSGRDAPVYKEEALEIFLSPDGNPNRYVELQVSPLGTLFDAAFSGGPRQHMQVGWNADYQAAVHVDGTLNKPTDRDRGWSTEWRINKASLGEAGAKCWRANLFHIGKERAVDGTPGPADESAWSPPLMGDFHNLERFGHLCFDSAQP